MTPHRCLAPIGVAGVVRPIDDTVDYDGPPVWYLEPVDEAARTEWLRTAARPEKAAAVRAEFESDPVIASFCTLAGCMAAQGD